MASPTNPQPPNPQSPFEGLSYDVALNCAARVPRSSHPNMSLVSKAMLSMVTSPLLFIERSQNQFTESLLYIFHGPPLSPSIFYLTPQHGSDRSCNPVRSIPSATVGAAYTSIGDTIYVLGGTIEGVPTANVWALDCRFNKWQAAPKMSGARELAAVEALDGKIFAIGGSAADNLAEAFNPKTWTWEQVSCPIGVRDRRFKASAVADGKIYALADHMYGYREQHKRGGIVYDAMNRVWDGIDVELEKGWEGSSCVLDEILYCIKSSGKIMGFSAVENVWRELRGIENRIPMNIEAKMANVGGKLMVVWSWKDREVEMGMEIWCIEIAVEKRDDEKELWGEILCSNKVASLRSQSPIVERCLPVSI